MPSVIAVIDICTSREASFDLIHDYSRRLDWDPFLREARLLQDARHAGPGVTARCVARRLAGGLAMDTVYISFNRPQVAAVQMIRGPSIFHSFAATIRHDALDENNTRITYVFNFKTKPRWLSIILEPVVRRIFYRETQRRLLALKQYMEDPTL